MKRLFAYHGAEHKTIRCYEAGMPLPVENVRSMSRLHPRCGTGFLLVVMILSILVFSVASSGLLAAVPGLSAIGISSESVADLERKGKCFFARVPIETIFEFWSQTT
jgi:hypothetical protein